jgi:hypothetical protein
VIQRGETITRRPFVGEIPGQRAPLTAHRQKVEDRVEHFSNIRMPFAPATPRRLDEGLPQTPLIVRQVPGLTHVLAQSVAMHGCPHGRRSSRIKRPPETYKYRVLIKRFLPYRPSVRRVPSTRGTPCDTGKYRMIRSICASASPIRSFA